LVSTVDINPEFEPTLCADVRKLTLKRILHTEGFFPEKYCVRPSRVVILASPPCERFSLANRTWPKHGIRQAFEIIGQCCEIIVEARDLWGKDSVFYAIENPKGRLRWFLGKPKTSIALSDYGGKYKKPTDLWTNIPLPLLDSIKPYEPSWSSVQNKGLGSTGLLRLRDPSKRAELPAGLSQALKEAVEV
jgi:hypothetical protein